MTTHCLVLAVRGDRLLLARKRRGFGAGRLVAPGGKVEPGEAPLDAAVRELEEETGLAVSAADLEDAGEIRFRFGPADDAADVMEVALYRTIDPLGEPVVTEELDAPAWYPVADLPLADMWLDNPHWLPAVLAGQRVEATIEYDRAAERIVSIRA